MKTKTPMIDVHPIKIEAYTAAAIIRKGAENSSPPTSIASVIRSASLPSKFTS